MPPSSNIPTWAQRFEELAVLYSQLQLQHENLRQAALRLVTLLHTRGASPLALEAATAALQEATDA